MECPQPVSQLHDAKARFSELFRRVRVQGPQRVVKQRGEAVVIVAAEDFDRASARAPAGVARRVLPFGANGRATARSDPQTRYDEDHQVVAGLSGCLLDTNVISELMKRRPSRRVEEWVSATSEDLLHLSVITIGEIRKGIDLLDDGPRRAPDLAGSRPP